MKKAIWLTGVFVIVFVLVVGCYLLFFQEKSSKVPEGTFVKMETTKRICKEYESGERTADGKKIQMAEQPQLSLPKAKEEGCQNRFLILRQNAHARREGMWDVWQQSA